MRPPRKIRSERQRFLFLHTLRAARDLTCIDTASHEAFANMTGEELKFLHEQKVESIYYLSERPNAPIQRLYDSIWRIQAAAIDEVSQAFVQEGLTLFLPQGADKNRRYFGDRALARRGDIDFMIPRKAYARAMEILSDLGFRVGMLDIKTAEILPSSAEDEAAIRAQAFYFDKEMAASRIQDIEVEEAVYDKLPSIFNPLVKVDGKVLCVVSFEPMYRYETEEPSLHWNYTRPSLFAGALAVQPELDVVLSCLRFSKGIRRNEGRGRLLVEMAATIANEQIDPPLIWSIAQRMGVEEDVVATLTFLALAMPDKCWSMLEFAPHSEVSQDTREALLSYAGLDGDDLSVLSRYALC